MIREVYLVRVPSVLSLKFPWLRPGRRKRASTHIAHTISAHRAPRNDRGTRPSPVVIPRLKASFNIYDLFRFNSTRKLEAYLYSSGWLAGWLGSSTALAVRAILIPRDRILTGSSEFHSATRRRKCSPSSTLNITFYSILF